MQKLITREGYYYVTICPKNRENIFGEIINDEKSVGANGCWPDNNAIQIKLNKFGLIVDEELKNMENLRGFGGLSSGNSKEVANN